MIGKLEETILLAALKCGPQATPATIHDAIVASVMKGDKEPAFGAIYTTINRMAAKKLLSVTNVIDEKGRDRRAFTVTASGQTALRQALHSIQFFGGMTLAGGMA